MLLVERYFADTVDGVVSMIDNLRHTVLGALHHHATAKDATEVGTLDGVHQTTGIDGADAVLCPIDGVGHRLALAIDDKNGRIAILDVLEKRQQVVGCQGRRLGGCCLGMIGGAVLVGTLLDALIP